MADSSFETSFDTSLDIKMNKLKLSDSPVVPALTHSHTPTETYASAVEPATPPLEASSPLGTIDGDEIEELLEHDLSSLKSDDVKADPILSSLAEQQSRPSSQTSKVQTGPTAFKARPAPVRQEGAGPRMTKSAALRQGLNWKAMSMLRGGSEGPKPSEVPVKPREAPKAVASLSAPAMAPRGTRSSMLRSGGDTALLPPKKDYAAQALINKANEKEERDRRRKSVALPASLSAPSIAPRQNRSSALRTGAPMPAPTRALKSSSAINVDQAKAKTEEPKMSLTRRASTGVKSLGAPTIVPRLNRSAMLRAPGSASAIAPTSASAVTANRPATAQSSSTTSTRPSHVRAQSTTSLVKVPPRPNSAVGPKPTKSSLLRAGLGAKVIT